MDKPAVIDQPPPYSATAAPTHGYPEPGPMYTQPPPSGPYPSSGPYPQPGYPHSPPPAQGYVPNYGSTTTYIVPSPIITIGGCPACRVGVLEDDFTCLGIMCCIVFFPIGILCCLALKNKRCSNCGAYFGACALPPYPP